MPHPALPALTPSDPDTRADWRLGAAPALLSLQVLVPRPTEAPTPRRERLTSLQESIRYGQDKQETAKLESQRLLQVETTIQWTTENWPPFVDLSTATPKRLSGWPERHQTAAASLWSARRTWLNRIQPVGDPETVTAQWLASRDYAHWQNLVRREPEPFAADSPGSLATHFQNYNDKTVYYAQFNGRVYEWRPMWNTKGPCWHPLLPEYRLDQFLPLQDLPSKVTA